MAGTTALFMMGQGVVGPVLPVFARDFGVGVTLVGLTVGVFGVGRFPPHEGTSLALLDSLS